MSKIDTDQVEGIGDLNNLTTTSKEVVGAINEVNGKTSALDDLGGRNMLLQSNIIPVRTYHVTYSFSRVVDISSPSGSYFRFANFAISGVSPSIYFATGNNADYSEDISGRQMIVSMYMRGSSNFLFANQPVGTTWTKVVFSRTWQAFGNHHLYFTGITSPITIDIAGVKIEKGNRSTDWTPAPEDQVSDWNETDNSKYSFIKNKPTLVNNYVDVIQTTNGTTAGTVYTFKRVGLSDLTLTLTAASASFSGVVTTGSQQFEGVKEFLKSPKVPTAVNNDEAVNKGQMVALQGDFLPKSYNSTSAIAATFSRNTTTTGRIKIRLPYGMSTKMLAFTIRLYSNYTHNDIACSGYLHAANNQWYAPSAKMIVAHGGNPNSAIDVIFGRDTDGRAYVSIPKRIYDSIAILDVLGAYTTGVWGIGWDILEDDTTPNIATTINVEGLNRVGQLTNDLGYILASQVYTQAQALGLFVGKTGVETIQGTKTFTSSPIVPNGTLAGHTVNVGQMQSYVTGQGFITTETDPTVPSHVKAITTTNISDWNGKYTLPSGGNSGQYINGLGQLTTFPTITTVNNGSFVVQGVGALTGAGSTSANTSANTTATLDLTPATKNDIQKGVDANDTLNDFFGSVSNRYKVHIVNNSGLNVITTDALITHVSMEGVSGTPTVVIQDHDLHGAELILNGNTTAITTYQINHIDRDGNVKPTLHLEDGSHRLFWDATYGYWRLVI